MRRRRKKSSPLRALFLWTLSLSLISWGLWQAYLLRQSLLTPPPSAFASTQPDLALDATSTNPVYQFSSTNDTTATAGPASQPLPQIENQKSKIENPLPPPLPTPTFDPALTANDLIAQATSSLNSGNALAARFTLNQALARTTDDTQAAELRQSLSALNAPIFLGPDLLPDDPCARMVDIQPGDNLYTIARAYQLNAAFLTILNPTLDPNSLKPNTGIKIVQGPFHARLIKHANRLDLYARDLYIASFPVDFPEGNLLPRGTYQISPGTKLQLPPSPPPFPSPAPPRTWIGFQGLEPATDAISNGWLFASAAPRGTDPKNRSTGIHLSDQHLQQLYQTLTESRSHLTVEP